MKHVALNGKLLELTLTGERVFARRGAMIAYDGAVTFKPVVGAGSGGAGGALGRMVAGENTSIMGCNGSGTVLYGYLGLNVTPIDLRQGDDMYVEADRLLVYGGSIRAGTMFLGSSGGVKGVIRGAVSGQGLFTTTLAGTGVCAILSHGAPVKLDVTPSNPVHVDPQAYVAHVGQLQNDLVSSAGWRDAVGKGSGEAFQLRLSGTGSVYVQPSEQTR